MTRPAAIVLPAMLAVHARAVRVQRQRVILQREAAILGDFLLALLDLGVEELLDTAALQADQVIVMVALVELEDRLAGLEVAAFEQPRLFELAEHAVDGRQADVLLFGKQLAIDVFGTHVPLFALLEDLEDLESRQRGFQPDVLQFESRHARAPAAQRRWDGVSTYHTDFRSTPVHHGNMNTDTAGYRPRHEGGADAPIPGGSRPGGRRVSRPGGARRAIPWLLAAALLAGGCATKDPNRSGLLEPYRIDLPQGNYLTREQVDQVREGMTRDQVRFILGTPLLGQLFQTDRWDYVFRYMHPNGQAETRRVLVRFADDRVKSVEADPLPLREDANDPALPGYRPGDKKEAS